ncbi:MAG: sugar ABC transporter permease [Spirochaetaceae bacterium]|nr:MAG: sugar ABC transporter permease [Spirochaetaceae bacterium]
MGTTTALSAHPRFKKAVPYLLITPALVFVIGILAYSVLYGIGMSFFRIDLAIPGRPFIGLENYRVVFSEERFINSFRRSLVFVFFSVTLGLLLSFGFANALYRVKKMSAGFRGFTLVPYLVSGIATAIMFRFLFSGTVGFINQMLMALGAERILFLGNPNWALFVVIVANTWFIVPFSTLVLLAGLQALDPDLFEVATVEGASKLTVLFRIIIPLIKPMIGISLVWMSFASFNMFDVILPLTGGGPGRATEVLAVYMYRIGFDFLRYSQGAVVMTVILVLNIAVSVFFLSVFRGED